MSMGEKTEKLFKAMEADEKLVEATMDKLTQLANQPLRIKIKNRATSEIIEIPARQLKDFEVSAFLKAQAKINPKILTATSPSDVGLSPEESDKLYELYDEYIQKATGLPKAKLRELGSIPIRFALIMGIMQGSSMTTKELEEIQKFRSDE